MQKNNVKTESVAEFIARGGNVEKLPTKGPKKTYRSIVKKAELDQEIDLDALPAALKIKYGIR